MVGFFSKRERHGFNRYAEEINRYQSTASVAGLPNRGVDRSASLTTSAGLAAQAALRNYEQKQHLSTPLSPNGLSNGLPRSRQSVGRTHSLTMHLTPLASHGTGNLAPNRANSLRTYVYNPLASYVAGLPTSGRRSQPVPSSVQLGRLSSLTSQGSRRANSLRNNSLNGLSYSRGLDSKQIGQIPEDAAISEEENFPDGTITSTKTTKIQDALGRVSLITVEIVRTLPDGLTVSETRTKNVSRPLLRLNSLTYRAGLMLSQSLYTMPQIDELHDFDGEYLSHDGRSAIPPAIPASSPTVRQPAIDKSPNLQQLTFERSPIVQALPQSARIEKKRTLSVDSNLKPLRLILKSSEDLRPPIEPVANSLEDEGNVVEPVEPVKPVSKQVRRSNSARSSIKSPVIGVSAAAAAAAASSGVFSSPSTTLKSEEDEFKDAQDSFSRSDNKNVPFGTEPQISVHPYKQRARLEQSPQILENTQTFSDRIALSKFQNVTNPDKLPTTLQPNQRLTKSPVGSREYEFASPTRSHATATHSSGNSIKFLDKVETIPNKPVPSEEEEMWLAAFKAAEANVLGNRVSGYQVSSPPKNNSTTKPNHSTSPSYYNTKRSMLITSSLVEESTQNHKIAIPDQNLSHLNQHEVDFDGVKEDYEYQNHHKSFRGHSMRQVLAAADTSLRKDRAREEKKLAKLKGKEIKQKEKEQALAEKEQTAAVKEKKKKEKKSRLSSLFVKRKVNEEPTSTIVSSTQFNEIDEIDHTPIGADDEAITKDPYGNVPSPTSNDHIVVVPQVGHGGNHVFHQEKDIENKPNVEPEVSSHRSFDPNAGQGQLESYNSTKPLGNVAEKSLKNDIEPASNAEAPNIRINAETRDSIPTTKQKNPENIDEMKSDGISGTSLTTSQVPLLVSKSTVPVVTPVTDTLNSREISNKSKTSTPFPNAVLGAASAGYSNDAEATTPTKAIASERNTDNSTDHTTETVLNVESESTKESGIVDYEKDNDRRYSHIEPNLKDSPNQTRQNRIYNDDNELQERLPDPTVALVPTSNEVPAATLAEGSVSENAVDSDSDTPPMAYSTPLDEAEPVFSLSDQGPLHEPLKKSTKPSRMVETTQIDSRSAPIGQSGSEETTSMEVRAYTPELEQQLADELKEPLRKNSVADAESLSGSILEKIDKDYKQDDHNGAVLDEFTKKLRAAAETVVSPMSDVTTGVGTGADVDTTSIPTSSIYLSPQKSVKAKNTKKLLFGFKKKPSEHNKHSEGPELITSQQLESNNFGRGTSKFTTSPGLNNGKSGTTNVSDGPDSDLHRPYKSSHIYTPESELARGNGGINNGVHGEGNGSLRSGVTNSYDGNIVDVDSQTPRGEDYNKSKKKSKFKEKFYKYFINTYD